MNSPYIPHLPSTNTPLEQSTPAYQTVKETIDDTQKQKNNTLMKLLSTILSLLILCTVGLYLYNNTVENKDINILKLQKIDVLEEYNTLKNEYDNPDIVRNKLLKTLTNELSKGTNLLTHIDNKTVEHGILDAPQHIADYINTVSDDRLDNVGTIKVRSIQHKTHKLIVDIEASHPLGKVFMLVSYYNDMLSGLPFLGIGDLNTLKRNTDYDRNETTNIRLEYDIIAPKPLLEDLYPYEQWLINTQ